MIKRVRKTAVGDIFCAKINDEHKKYFQYIISDLTQLNSDVIRVFKRTYPIDTEPALEEVISGEVDFYVHCDTRAGIKNELWEKVGNSPNVGQTEHIIFKSKRDYTRLDVQDDWWIWKINGEHIFVGELKGEHKKAYLGLVFQSASVMHKLKTGLYPGGWGELESIT